MSPEIKRQTELFLCAQLAAACPGLVFVPSKGFDEVKELEPPFTVLAMGDASKTMATEMTWQMKGTAQIITHLGDTRAGDHALLVRQILAALATIPSVGGHAEAAAVEAAGDFIFHGLDITGTRESQDNALKAHADIVDFTCGVSA